MTFWTHEGQLYVQTAQFEVWMLDTNGFDTPEGWLWQAIPWSDFLAKRYAHIPELREAASELEIKPGAIKIWLYDLLIRELPDKAAAMMIANAVAYPLAERVNMSLRHSQALAEIEGLDESSR